MTLIIDMRSIQIKFMIMLLINLDFIHDLGYFKTTG